MFSKKTNSAAIHSEKVALKKIFLSFDRIEKILCV